QVILTLLLTLVITHAVKPPGLVRQAKAPDPNPPRYAYGYDIADKEVETGKQEQREGEYAQGRYYVQDKDTNQDIQYFADDWGYHPVVEYSNEGPFSKSKAKFALDHEAVQQLRNKEKNLPQLQGLPDTGNLQDPGISSSKARQEDPQEKSSITPLPPQEQNVTPQAAPTQVQFDPSLLQQPQLQQQLVNGDPQVLFAGNVVASESSVPQGNIIFLQPTGLPDGPNLFQNSFPGPLLPLLGGEQLLFEADGPGAKLITPQQLDGRFLDFSTFGLKVKENPENKHAKLIESTKDLVSGQDVLNLNAAIPNGYHDTTTETVTSQSTSTESYSTTVSPITTTESNLEQKPIVVAEIGDNSISSTVDVSEPSTYSTTPNYVETISTTFETSTSPPSTVVVTPRPVSTQFLAPITAGVRLDNEEKNDIAEKKSEAEENVPKEDTQVEIQKTIPYYLGKLEYPMQYDTNYDYTGNITQMMATNAAADLELSKTLLYFPMVPPDVEVNNHLTNQQLPKPVIKEKFTEMDYQQYEMQQTQQNRVVAKPLPIQLPYQAPYHVASPVAIPVKVDKVSQKHGHVIKMIQKPIIMQQPYHVHKIIEKPVHVPVVSSYRQYPFDVRVPYQYPQYYPMQHVKQQYHTEVKVPLSVERRVPVRHHIQSHVSMDRAVQKPIPHYVPYYIQVPTSIPAVVPQNYVQEPVKQSPEPQAQHSQQQSFLLYAPAARNNVQKSNNGYLPPARSCEQESSSNLRYLYFARPEELPGLMPPKPETRFAKSHRTARSNFDESSIRMEYGFMPPLIPSIEIDEYGRPIDKGDK
ncbi:unnamed protein product, partial [Callosobruchus maculatus]